MRNLSGRIAATDADGKAWPLLVYTPIRETYSVLSDRTFFTEGLREIETADGLPVKYIDYQNLEVMCYPPVKLTWDGVILDPEMVPA